LQEVWKEGLRPAGRVEGSKIDAALPVVTWDSMNGYMAGLLSASAGLSGPQTLFCRRH
jgi:hypothetical protein